MNELINDVISDLSLVVGEAMSSIFADVASFAPSLFSLGLLIYVFVTGITMLAGMALSLNKVLMQLVLFIALYAFATEYEVIAKPLYELVTGWVNDFASLRGLSFGETVLVLISNVSLYCDIASDEMPWGTRTIAYVLLAVLIAIPALIMVGILLMSYLTVIVISAITIAILPILFIFGMFSPTRDMLMGGIRMVAQYLILGLLAILVLKFVTIIVGNMTPKFLVELRDGNQTVFKLSIVYGMLIYLFMLITMQLPNLAANIAGGLAANTGSLTQSAMGLAKRHGQGLMRGVGNAATHRKNGSNRIMRNSRGKIRGSESMKSVGRKLRPLTQKSTYRNA